MFSIDAFRRKYNGRSTNWSSCKLSSLYLFKKLPYQEGVQLLCIHYAVLVMVKTLHCRHLLTKTYFYMSSNKNSLCLHSRFKKETCAIWYNQKTPIGISTPSWMCNSLTQNSGRPPQSYQDVPHICKVRLEVDIYIKIIRLLTKRWQIHQNLIIQRPLEGTCPSVSPVTNTF